MTEPKRHGLPSMVSAFVQVAPGIRAAQREATPAELAEGRKGFVMMPGPYSTPDIYADPIPHGQALIVKAMEWAAQVEATGEDVPLTLPPTPSASAPQPPQPPPPSSPASTHPMLKNFVLIGYVSVIGGRVSIVASSAHCTFAGAAALETAIRALHKSDVGYTSAPYAGDSINDTSAGVILQPTWGDGTYPVYASLDKMKRVRGVFIDFEV